MNESFPEKQEKQEALPLWAIEIGQRYHECKIISDKIEHDLGNITQNNEGEIAQELARQIRIAFYDFIQFIQTEGKRAHSIIPIFVQSKPQKHGRIGNAFVSTAPQKQTYFIPETNERFEVSGNYSTEEDVSGSNYYVFPESPHFPGIKTIKDEKWIAGRERRNRDFQKLQVEKSRIEGGMLDASEVEAMVQNLQPLLDSNDHALGELRAEIKRLQDEANAKYLRLQHEYSISLKNSIINLVKVIQKTGKVKLPDAISGAANIDYSSYLFLLTKEAKIVEAPAHRKKKLWKETDEPDLSRPDLSKAKEPDEEFMLTSNTLAYYLLKQLPANIRLALES